MISPSASLQQSKLLIQQNVDAINSERKKLMNDKLTFIKRCQTEQENLDKSKSDFEEEKLEFNNAKNAFEQEKLEFNNIKNAFKQEKLEFNNVKNAFEQEKQEFNNAKNAFEQEKTVKRQGTRFQIIR